jgi:hypothetical protein
VGVIEGISLFTDAKQAADENRAVKDTSEGERLIGGNITPGIVEQVAVPKPQSLVTLRAWCCTLQSRRAPGLCSDRPLLLLHHVCEGYLVQNRIRNRKKYDRVAANSCQTLALITLIRVCLCRSSLMSAPSSH